MAFWAAVSITAGLLFAIHTLDKRAAKRRELTEFDALFLLARLTETSELEQFRRAAEGWNMSERRVERDFNRYLFQAEIPHYVRDYLRKAKESDADLQKSTGDFFTGIFLGSGSKRK
jgi:hypothetical protein